jgi:hypothetical protein
MKTQKKPCSVCRRWFVPNARVGQRQRTCGTAPCREMQRRRTQARWRKANPGYWRDLRLHEQMEKARRRGAVQAPAASEPAMVAAIPWQQAQDAMGPEAAVFIAFVVRLAARQARSALQAQELRLRDEMKRSGLPAQEVKAAAVEPAARSEAPQCVPALPP